MIIFELVMDGHSPIPLVSEKVTARKNKMGRAGRVRTSWQINVQYGENFGLLNTILSLPPQKSKYFAENPNLDGSSSGNTKPGVEYVIVKVTTQSAHCLTSIKSPAPQSVAVPSEYPNPTSYPVFLSIPDPTRFSFGNHRVAGNPKHRVLPDISGKPEVSGTTQYFGYHP